MFFEQRRRSPVEHLQRTQNLNLALNLRSIGCQSGKNSLQPTDILQFGLKEYLCDGGISIRRQHDVYQPNKQSKARGIDDELKVLPEKSQDISEIEK